MVMAISRLKYSPLEKKALYKDIKKTIKLAKIFGIFSLLNDSLWLKVSYLKILIKFLMDYLLTIPPPKSGR